MARSCLRINLLSEPTRSELARALARMIVQEVEKTRGARGLALRHGLRTAMRRNPDALERVVDELIPEWIDLLEPYYLRWSQNEEDSFGQYLGTHSDELAVSLLALLHRRVRSSNHRLAQAATRFFGVDALRSALPRVGVLVDGYVSAS